MEIQNEANHSSDFCLLHLLYSYSDLMVLHIFSVCDTLHSYFISSCGYVLLIQFTPFVIVYYPMHSTTRTTCGIFVVMMEL